MHFALPPRKTSHPPPYANRQSSSFTLRRRELKLLSVVALGVITLIYLLSHTSSGATQVERIPAGTPTAVIITLLDPRQKQSHVDSVIANRKAYAKKHGYATFFPNSTDYPIQNSPPTWAKVPAIRHAMSLYPHSTYFFFLHHTALIANPSLDLVSHVMDKERLESLMVKDVPVVPPDSVIRTFPHLKGDRIDLVMSQDGEGLSGNSMILRRGEWATFFLDVWFDPIYRTYNFQKAENHALEHIVQWHGTVLAKLALVPQKIINAYHNQDKRAAKGGIYTDGDFIANYPGCDFGKDRDCDEEMAPLILRLKELYHY